MNGSLYQTLLTMMGEGFLMVSSGGTILSVNPAFEAMTGYTSGELVGQSCSVLNCTGCKIFDGAKPGEPWCGLFLKGSVRQRRCQLVAKDGRTVHIVKHGTVLRDENGHVTGAIEALTDVSDIVFKEEEIQTLRMELQQQTGVCGMVGSSKVMQDLVQLTKSVALSGAPVLIQGESGVGKELVARAIHEFGFGGEKAFVKVNCASLNENLLESELFGHVKGAFTGANRDRVGRFEAAAGGSIFLDEIGEASLQFQVKLLRVLECKEIERVGDHRPIPVETRIIAATNKNLSELVARKLFREDLFYRINVVPIRVPPLRERLEDVPLLAQTYIERIAAHSGKVISGLDSEALKAMLAYDWPGNVRELRNTIEHAFVLCTEPLIGIHHLPSQITDSNGCRREDPSTEKPFSTAALRSRVDAMERESLVQALKQAGGSRSKAAEILGVSRVTVWKRIKKYEMETD